MNFGDWTFHRQKSTKCDGHEDPMAFHGQTFQPINPHWTKAEPSDRDWLKWWNIWNLLELVWFHKSLCHELSTSRFGLEPVWKLLQLVSRHSQKCSKSKYFHRYRHKSNGYLLDHCKWQQYNLPGKRRQWTNRRGVAGSKGSTSKGFHLHCLSRRLSLYGFCNAQEESTSNQWAMQFSSVAVPTQFWPDWG